MRTITLEEHFGSPGFLAGPGREFMERIRNSGPRGAKIYEQLKDCLLYTSPSPRD